MGISLLHRISAPRAAASLAQDFSKRLAGLQSSRGVVRIVAEAHLRVRLTVFDLESRAWGLLAE